MKKAIVFCLLVLSLCPAVLHGAAGYVGLYTTYDRTTSAWCPFGENSMARIELWIWFLPLERGIIGAEFALEYPPNVIPSVVTYNPGFSVVLGQVPGGVSAAFAESDCQTNWFWFCHQTFWVTSGEITILRIKPHPDAYYGFVGVATCEMGYPIDSVMILSHLWINQSSAPMLPCVPPLEVVVGTESASWGAIRSLF